MTTHLQIPKILTVQANFADQVWNIFYPEEYHNLLVEQDVLKTRIAAQLKNYTTFVGLAPFRLQLSVESVPCLVAFFPQKREIRMLSACAGRELILLREVEDAPELHLFREHVVAVTGMRSLEAPSVWELLTAQHALPSLLQENFADVAELSHHLEKRILQEFSSYQPKLFERFSDFALGLSSDYALVRIHLLKFLAILPSLEQDVSGREVKRMFMESYRRLITDAAQMHEHASKRHPQLPKWLLAFARLNVLLAKMLPAYVLAKLIRAGVKILALRFIAGESIEKASVALQQLRSSGRDATLDQLGELVVSEAEASIYEEQVLKLIRGFSLHVAPGTKNSAGILSAHVSLKMSALTSDFNPEAPDATYAVVGPRLRKILCEAKQHQVFINVDAEHYDYRNLSLEMLQRTLLETSELADFADVGIVVQAYLRDAYPHFQEVLALAQKRGLCMPIRLVKGAYWDAETIHADAHHYVAPQFLNKEESDLHFRQLTIKILEASPHVQLCLGSHNVADHCFAEAIRKTRYPEALPIEHQCLHMTFEPLSTAMARLGWAVRNYIPIGSLLVGMAYLVRRIMENSSQVGVLTKMRQYRGKYEQISPEEVHRQQKQQGSLSRDIVERTHANFFNVAPVRLYCPDERAVFVEALQKLTQELPLQFHAEHRHAPEEHAVISPSQPELIVGKIRFANSQDTEAALQKLDAAYNTSTWVTAPAVERASVLLKAAQLMLVKRLHLASVVCFEAGKQLNEALGDVDEAIDFLNFYAREELRVNHEGSKLGSRGVVAVISPWNFPLAIPCGMVVGSLVAGNAVILKSAEQTPLVAEELINLLYEAGVPHDMLCHLPGKGEIIGKQLVEDERVSTIVFTGSKAVGLWIAQTAGKRIYHNKRFGFHVPVRVIAEMGGKNAIVVTQNAELDEAVSGVIASAFGHAGQKCSAASRVLVHQSIKERFAMRLSQGLRDLEVGRADDFAVFVNPVVSAAEKARLQNAVKSAVQEAEAYDGKVWCNRSQEVLPGFAMGPSLIELPLERGLHPESIAQQELFGPVLHLIPFETLEQAVQLFNSTEYGLTGGIYSQSQDDTDFLLTQLQAGNLYVNRPCTGARVGVEPFGGFKHSGTGPKAGGIHYLPALHVNLDAVETLPTTVFAGKPLSDQAVQLCVQTTQLSPEKLLQFEKLLTQLSNQAPYLFASRAHTAQVVFEWWREWLLNDGKNYFWKHHWNARVPGQLSFNDLRQVKSQGVVLARNAEPQLPTLLYALSALATGASLTILCSTHESSLVWKVFEGALRSCGFSVAQCTVYACNAAQIQSVLADTRVEFCIVDGQPELERVALAGFMDGKGVQMRQIYTQADAPDVRDYQRYLDTFVHVRSFAINTMRHGAPLEVEWS